MPNQTNIKRREFIRQSSIFAGASAIFPNAAWSKSDSITFENNPFTLGIASGDPWPDGVVLWTRLAPDSLNGGGMPNQPVSVKWEVTSDEQMKKIVAKGTAIARPESGHSVHVEVHGLQPSRWYWYRFTVNAGSSPVGRTRTAPALNAANDRINFAFVSCQHYETGFFTAYKHLAQEDLDLVLHLGDYIYESGVGKDRPRKHNSDEIATVEDYRNRYALYKSDPLLQQAHAQYPWAVVWDDHEVDNNYAGLTPEDNQTPEDFARRRAIGYQVYYEHMPLRKTVLQPGNNVRIYRQIPYGKLANFNMLDTRQFRDDQPCGDGSKQACPESLLPNRTMLGDKQETWLKSVLSNSKARWNILAQQVMIGALDIAPGPEKFFPMDKWDGYVAARQRLLEFIRDRKPSNPVVLTGDIHTNWVNDLKPEFYREDSPVVATEFVGTSITSAGDGTDVRPTTASMLSENPHVKFFNAHRGYVRCTVTPQHWQTDFRIVEVVSKPDAPISTRASFVVESGKAGAVRA